MVAIAYPATSEESIPRASLRAILGMRLQKWPADTPVKVFVLKDDSPEHATFSKTVLQVFPHQLRMGLGSQVFSGQGQYPRATGFNAGDVVANCLHPWSDRLRQGE
jgi:hypothetical protein